MSDAENKPFDSTERPAFNRERRPGPPRDSSGPGRSDDRPPRRFGGRFGGRRDFDRRGRSATTMEFRPLEVPVINGNLEGAIRALKRKMNREGILKQLKLKRFHEKPSVRRKRKRKEAERRRRRLLRRLAKRALMRKH